MRSRKSLFCLVLASITGSVCVIGPVFTPASDCLNRLSYNILRPGDVPGAVSHFDDGITTVAASTTVRSYMTKAEEVNPEWFVVDANAQIVGRLATCIATVLMGKHKPTYTPHVDGGDVVVVLNADQIRMSGRQLPHPTNPYFTGKMMRKEYQRYSGYPGGLKRFTAEHLLEKKPEMILSEAVRRMLPRNKLTAKMMKRLKIYTGDAHPHQAQNPKPMPEYWLPPQK